MHLNMKTSRLLAVVVSVGAAPPAQRIPENQVTVREPVVSCWRMSENCWPVVGLLTARVRLPPSWTWCQSVMDRLNVIVAPSVSVVIVPQC